MALHVFIAGGSDPDLHRRLVTGSQQRVELPLRFAIGECHGHDLLEVADGEGVALGCHGHRLLAAPASARSVEIGWIVDLRGRSSRRVPDAPGVNYRTAFSSPAVGGRTVAKPALRS